MSSPHSKPSASAAPSKSENAAVMIYVFECGQGDTVLVNLPGNKWVLVDCHLPEGRIRKHFFQFIDGLGIKKLDLVCLTHAHRDHFHGMLQVVEHFTKPGKSIGYYCDSGVDPN